MNNVHRVGACDQECGLARADNIIGGMQWSLRWLVSPSYCILLLLSALTFVLITLLLYRWNCANLHNLWSADDVAADVWGQIWQAYIHSCEWNPCWSLTHTLHNSLVLWFDFLQTMQGCLLHMCIATDKVQSGIWKRHLFFSSCFGIGRYTLLPQLLGLLLI